jgi:protein TonB
MKWPAALKVPFEDKVIVRFVVEIDGSLTHIHIESATSYCPPCNKEAIRLVQQMPKWKPATKNGEPVRIWVQVPINFQVY